MFTVIIIPCYNEEKRLDCNAFAVYMEQHPETVFYFVNDGSSDHTSEILQNLAGKHNANLKDFIGLSFLRNQ